MFLATWPECVNYGYEITLSATNPHPDAAWNAGQAVANKETCSKACQNDVSCNFWQYEDNNNKMCAFRTTMATAELSAKADMIYGKKDCVGLVPENQNGNVPIDGNWSPWSSVATPCIDKLTGDKVECGGGVRLRYRSCTDPEPRFGGKVRKTSAIPAGIRTQDLWIRSPTRYPLRYRDLMKVEAIEILEQRILRLSLCIFLGLPWI